MRTLVVDASVVIDLLARFDASPLDELFLDPRTLLAAPMLLDIEVLQVFRRLDRQARHPVSASGFLDDFRALRIQRYPHGPLLARIWELRENLTAYDATYVALAEALNAQLVTRDRRLAAAPLGDFKCIVP